MNDNSGDDSRDDAGAMPLDNVIPFPSAAAGKDTPLAGLSSSPDESGRSTTWVNRDDQRRLSRFLQELDSESGLSAESWCWWWNRY